MTINRLITTLIQLALFIPAAYGVRAIIEDFRSGNFWRDINHTE